MNNALTITFKKMDRIEHLAEFTENRFDRLRRKNPSILRGAVVISEPHRSQRNGNSYRVSLRIYIPGRTLVAKRRTDPDRGIDLYGAITDAFHSLQTQLKSRQEKVSHPPLTLTEVAELFV